MLGGLLGGSSKLSKAKLMIIEGGLPVVLDVQFNPSEYTITRGVKLDNKTAAGQQTSPSSQQVTSGDSTTLSVSLYFDAYTDLDKFGLSNIKSMVQDPSQILGQVASTVAPNTHKDVNELCEQVSTLVRYIANLHEPPTIRFIWGAGLKFEGIVESSTIQYTMFAPNGQPVRIRVDLSIVGEEVELIQEEKANPFESPDRTKERVLPYGDQLWMVAEDEYGDPGEWKTIAKANDILNPRTIDRAVRLKVPSIQ